MVLLGYVHISAASVLSPCTERCRNLRKSTCRDGRKGGSFGSALDTQMLQGLGGRAPSDCVGMMVLSCLGVPGIYRTLGNSASCICGPVYTAPLDNPSSTCISCARHRLGGTYGCTRGHTPGGTGRADHNHPQGNLRSHHRRTPGSVFPDGSDSSTSKHHLLGCALSECVGCCSTV